MTIQIEAFCQLPQKKTWWSELRLCQTFSLPVLSGLVRLVSPQNPPITLYLPMHECSKYIVLSLVTCDISTLVFIIFSDLGSLTWFRVAC
jgi:hypothetical protein